MKRTHFRQGRSCYSEGTKHGRAGYEHAEDDIRDQAAERSKRSTRRSMRDASVALRRPATDSRHRRERVDRSAAIGMHFEVQVRSGCAGVARVTDVADNFTRVHTGSDSHRVTLMVRVVVARARVAA